MPDNLNDKNDATPGQDNSQGGKLDDLTKERYKQQIEGSKAEVEKQKAEAQKAIDLAYTVAVKAAELDGSTLLELHEKDPALAERVAKEGFGKTIDEVKAIVAGGNQPQADTTQETDEEKFQKRYAERSKKEKHADALKFVDEQFSKLGSDELQGIAKEKFDKLAGDKMLDREVATELVEMVTLYVSRDQGKPELYDDMLKAMTSTGLSKKTGATKTVSDDDESNLVVRDGKLFNLKTQQYV